jgi:hemolysin activation/secretion protein
MAYRLSNTARHWRFSPYGFYDLGAVWQVHPQALDDRASLASCGLGVRAIGAGFSAYLELGKPLTRAVASQGNDGKKERLFAGIAYEF